MSMTHPYPDESGARARSGPPPRRFLDPGNGWVSPGEKAMLTTGGLLVLAGLVFAGWTSYQIDQTKSAVHDNKVETARNRAVGCQLLLVLGQPLSDECLNPAVLPFYDPKAKPAPTSNTALICEIAREIGVPERKFPQVCAEVDGDD